MMSLLELGVFKRRIRQLFPWFRKVETWESLNLKKVVSQNVESYTSNLTLTFHFDVNTLY
jgi:hypothetical protein